LFAPQLSDKDLRAVEGVSSRGRGVKRAKIGARRLVVQSRTIGKYLPTMAGKKMHGQYSWLARNALAWSQNALLKGLSATFAAIAFAWQSLL
jgi:hypothetical protein